MSEQNGETLRWAQVAATAFLGVVGLVFTGVQVQADLAFVGEHIDLDSENIREYRTSYSK